MTTPLVKAPVKIASSIKVNLYGESCEIDLYVTRYVNPPGLAVIANGSKQGDPFGKVSISVPESALLPDWGFFAHEYSEGEAWVPQLLNLEPKLFELLDIETTTGYVRVRAWKLTSSVIDEVMKSGVVE